MNASKSEYSLCQSQILTLATSILEDVIRDKAPRDIQEKCEDLVMLLEKQHTHNTHCDWVLDSRDKEFILTK